MKKLLLGTCLPGQPRLRGRGAEGLSLVRIHPRGTGQKFEAETGIDVTIDTYDSNEAMLAALKAGKMGQYDVAVPGDYMVKIMGDEGLLDNFAPEDARTSAISHRSGLTCPSIRAAIRRSPISGDAPRSA